MEGVFQGSVIQENLDYTQNFLRLVQPKYTARSSVNLALYLDLQYRKSEMPRRLKNIRFLGKIQYRQKFLKGTLRLLKPYRTYSLVDATSGASNET